jgi:hypothetical protein
MAARSKASIIFGSSNIGIGGSNPARGMVMCLRFSVSCCLGTWADPPPK